MRPPHLSEIFLLPLLGVCACDAFVTRHNELLFFFMPFLFVVIRMYLTQFKAPVEHQAVPDESFERFKARYLVCEHLATFVLLFVEAGSVIARSPTVPMGAWVFVGASYLVYVSLRLAARGAWMRATGESMNAGEGTMNL